MTAAFKTPKRLGEITPQPIAENVCARVRTASVVFADYAALQSDFPQLRTETILENRPELRSLSARLREEAVHAAIDEWLLLHGALVTVEQAKQTWVNERISIGEERVKIGRPRAYGRAGIVSLRESWRNLPVDAKKRWPREPHGLLDLKGIGVADGVTPQRRFFDSYSAHGLCSLGRALGEVSWARMLRTMFEHAGAPFAPLPIYAVIDLGINDFKGRAVGIQVRAAHRRNNHDFYHPIGAPAYQAAVVAEFVLRHYGVTTTAWPCTVDVRIHRGRGRYAITRTQVPQYDTATIRRFLDIAADGRSRDQSHYINVQATVLEDPSTLAMQMYDLEPLIAVTEFRAPVVMMVGNRVCRWGGTLTPRDPEYPQPNPACALPVADWGFAAPKAGEGKPRHEGRYRGPTRRGMEWAAAYRAGKISRGDIVKNLERFEQRATRKWPRRSNALEIAHRAADALFARGATTGARLLDAEPDRKRGRRLDAAESLLALAELRDLPAKATSKNPHAPSALGHRVRWNLRRWLASDGMRRLEAKLRRGSSGDAEVAAALARLKAPDDLALRDVRTLVGRLAADPRVAACEAQWEKVLESVGR